ncbi:MAG: hypothetical protein ABIH23_14490 [bacterium]
MKKTVDFDGEPVRLIQDCYAIGEQSQRPRWNQAQRDWLLYNAYTDIRDRDPNMPNVSLPKIYSIVETKNPDKVSALFGRHPVFPIFSRRREFRPVTDVFSEVVDYLCGLGGLYEDGSLLCKLATLYGTSYIEAIPHYEKVVEESLVRAKVGGFQKVSQEGYRLRFMFNVWAIWEILHDPIATSLRNQTSCRWVIKPHLTTKRAIKQLYEEGSYPGLDLDQLESSKKSGLGYRGEHFGHRMLQAYGLPQPAGDDDIGVLLRFESSDRYVDSWMGELTLRDGDNPYPKEKKGHGLINLSKLTNVQTPHTQQQWYGIGEAKPNEVLAAILNDSWNMTLLASAILSNPLMFYRKGGVNKDDMVFAPMQRIPVSGEKEKPISDNYDIYAGQALPPQHYEIPDRLERFMDLGSGDFGPGRGEGMRSGGGTASEAIIATEKGSKRQEGQFMLDEAGFKSDFLRKLLGHVGQFSQFGDVAEVVGPDRAMLAYVSNPADLPGGYNMEFSGSSRVRQRQTQFDKLREIAPVLIQDISARPGGVSRKLADLIDFNQDEIDDMLLTPDELDMKIRQDMLMQQQQQQMEYDQQSQIEDKRLSAKTPPGNRGGGSAFTKQAKKTASV